VSNKHSKEDNIQVLSPQVDTLLSCQKISPFSHRSGAQPSEDSVMQDLEDALSRAYEEIAELRRRILELETQATELFKSYLPTAGKFF